MKLTREERLIHVPPITNVRDLGGYELAQHKYTKPKQYVRSAIISGVEDAQKEKLYEYGVRVVVDLRSDYEIEKYPHSMRNYKDVKYYNVNLLDDANAMVVPEDIKDLGDVYIYLVDHCAHKLKEVFEIFATYPDKTKLFNCSAGKDRTGVIAAMLLDLVGCPRETIVEDYQETFENNLPIYDMLLKESGEENKHMLESYPKHMNKFLDYFYAQYKDTYTYLKDIGLQEEKIKAIQEAFIL